ncbi:MAG: cytochrome c family protein [Deltaproteobacteria bacterium]|nr:cytochrome c family protein [Deltaproteobacteria bacterium]
MATLGRGWPRAILAGGAWALLGAGRAEAAATEPLELSNALVPADQCEYCHTFQNAPDAATDPLYAPYFSWRGSMMANAAVDPVFWAGVAIASQDAVLPEETQACIRCHSPRAFLEGRGDAISLAELTVQDRAGVECEACHRMVADEPPGNAQYTIDDVAVNGMVPRRGPWSYPPGEGIPPPPHEALVDSFIGSAQLCGTCHDVTTDRERVDAQGVGLGVGFNEQRTYSEWAASAYAVQGDGFASCQSCHMPAVADAPGCRDNVNVYAHAQGARRHDLLGANRFVIELLEAEASVLDSQAFDHSLTLLDEFVRTAATLEVTVPDGIHMGEGLADLGVIVTNETGHKLPTGYSEGRVMWLEVVTRLGDTEIWTSGRWDPQTQTWEEDDQLRTYQGLAVEQATGDTFHLLRNDYWEEDTRIPPLGLTPGLETDPQTERYALLPDGTWPNYDELSYAFDGRPELEDPTPDDPDDDALEVSVRLLYVINTREYVEFLSADNVTNQAGTDLEATFDAAGWAPPLVLADYTANIPILSFGEPTSGSTGREDTTGDPGDTATSAGSTSLPGGTAGSETTLDGGSADGDGTGCSCRTNHPTPPAGLWIMLLGGLGALRRRRRRC